MLVERSAASGDQGSFASARQRTLLKWMAECERLVLAHRTIECFDLLMVGEHVSNLQNRGAAA